MFNALFTLILVAMLLGPTAFLVVRQVTLFLAVTGGFPVVHILVIIECGVLIVVIIKCGVLILVTIPAVFGVTIFKPFLLWHFRLIVAVRTSLAAFVHGL